jgi:hypothetical protein
MLENTRNVKTHTGNGVTTVFPYDFLIDDEDYAEVTLLEIATGIVTTLVLEDGDFSIDGIGVDEGGNVTYNPGTPLASTHKINIRRVVPLVQNMDINNQTGFLPDVLEDQLDLMVMQIQQVSEKADRAVTVEIGSGLDPQALIAGVLTALEDTQAAAAAAAASESAAAVSEAAAETAKDDAETAVASIGTSVSDAASSASAALASEIAAGLSEDAASASEIAAAASESAAAGSASTASTAADTATTKAGEASASADAASLAETAAEAAQTAAEAAQAAAEAAAGGMTDVPTQINAAADTAFADADMLTARKDSDGSLIKRSWANVKALIWTALGGLINGGTAKTTPVDGDLLAIADSAASNATKKLSLTDLWANYLKAKADALYIAIGLFTTRGDIIYRGASAPVRLPKGTSGQVLTMGADDPAWATPAGGSVDTYNAVGSYIMGYNYSATSTPGGSYAGSNITAGGVNDAGPDAIAHATALPGTWRAMGYASGAGVTLFTRTV